MVKSRSPDDLNPDLYKLNLDLSQTPLQGTILISGTRKYKPSHRITLHQKDLKIQKVRLYTQRRKISYELSIERVNYLPTMEQVRIHTKELIYPGEIKLEVVFFSNLKPAEYIKIVSFSKQQLMSHFLRAYFPLVDELQSKKNAEFEIGYTK